MNVYLIRHGKTLGKPALNGRTDVGVADAIQDQICDSFVAKNLPIGNLVTSPLRRCFDLAKRIEAAIGVTLQVEPRFQEMDFGVYDGVSFDALYDKWSILESFWKDPANHNLPDAEKLSDFHERVVAAWEQLVAEMTGDTLIICHGGTIRILLAHLLRVDWRNPFWYSNLYIANQSMSHVQITKHESLHFQVRSIGVVSF